MLHNKQIEPLLLFELLILTDKGPANSISSHNFIDIKAIDKNRDKEIFPNYSYFIKW